ncbi:carbohydrate kinase family protein [Pelistega sp. NLN82]|uniref:Carbohydrate kinase family protein n=1 Tax=Pelistega ratti TaxID=2652177 RepID=A0A6L9Y680_9BURK|nr:carbohydrate kinase family protein [Pelistega ratti]NEN75334.1 carbohydrate kinase family protein [Pelistega ratti]
MSSSPVLICGSIAFDTITLFEGHFKEHILPENIKSLSISFLVPTMRKEFGGCAGNIAYSLKMLGGNPIPVATVGKDATDYLHYFEQLGIRTDGIKIISDAFTAQCHITTDLDGNQLAAFHPGAMSASATNTVEITDAAWAIVAPDAKEGMFAHAERLHQQGIPFIFDLGQAMPLFEQQDLERMIGLAQAITVNDYEASIIAQRVGKRIEELSHCVEAIVVTKGAEGASLYIKGEETHIPPVKAEKICDPTGCGDAHRGGLLYGLTQGWPWYESACLASLMGTLKIAVEGPQNYHYSREELAQKLEDAYGIGLLK